MTRFVVLDVCTLDYSLCTLALTMRGAVGYKRKKDGSYCVYRFGVPLFCPFDLLLPLWFSLAF